MERDEKSLKGRLLVAAPDLDNDETFRRTVIYLADHDERSATGLILNRPSRLILTQLFPETAQAFPVYRGGPVDTDTLFFLHRVPRIVPGGLPLNDTLFWGGDFTAVKRALACGRLSENDIRFYIGYAGWGAGQLEEEIREKSWLVLPGIADPWNTPDEGLWEKCLCGEREAGPIACGGNDEQEHLPN